MVEADERVLKYGTQRALTYEKKPKIICDLTKMTSLYMKLWQDLKQIRI